MELLIASLQSVVDQVHDALARGLTLEQTRQFVKLDDTRKRFTGGDATLDAEFDGNFTQPSCDRFMTRPPRNWSCTNRHLGPWSEIRGPEGGGGST